MRVALVAIVLLIACEGTSAPIPLPHPSGAYVATGCKGVLAASTVTPVAMPCPYSGASSSAIVIDSSRMVFAGDSVAWRVVYFQSNTRHYDTVLTTYHVQSDSVISFSAWPSFAPGSTVLAMPDGGVRWTGYWNYIFFTKQ